MVSTTNQAQIKWAEREDKVWVTVNHPSPTDVKTDLTATSLKVSFTARDQPYAFEFEFNKEIKVDDTKQSDLYLFSIFIIEIITLPYFFVFIILTFFSSHFV